MGALADLELLAGASPAQVDVLATLVAPVHVPAGASLIEQGEVDRTFVLLLDGTVAVTRGTHQGPVVVGDGGAGSIFGELSTITGEPRRATVTAITEVDAVRGGIDAFDALLAIPGVFDWMVDLATQRLAEIAHPVPVTLRDGTPLVIRPLVARDREAFAAALDRQPAEWRHSRFFSAVKPSPALIEYLVHLDYVGHFAWAVGRPDPIEGVGTARLIRLRDAEHEAELAFEVEDAWRGHGVGTVLLGALGAAAARLGIDTFRAEVLYENRAMRKVMNKAGARWTHAETGVMETAFPATAAATLLPAETVAALGAVVDQVIEVAGLALWRGGPA
jgi:RimJ/RimL family protein N-acetyltransferase